jgi:hypothetical protein
MNRYHHIDDTGIDISEIGIYVQFDFPLRSHGWRLGGRFKDVGRILDWHGMIPYRRTPGWDWHPWRISLHTSTESRYQ